MPTKGICDAPTWLWLPSVRVTCDRASDHRGEHRNKTVDMRWSYRKFQPAALSDHVEDRIKAAEKAESDRNSSG